MPQFLEMVTGSNCVHSAAALVFDRTFKNNYGCYVEHIAYTHFNKTCCYQFQICKCVSQSGMKNVRFKRNMCVCVCYLLLGLMCPLENLQRQHLFCFYWHSSCSSPNSHVLHWLFQSTTQVLRSSSIKATHRPKPTEMFFALVKPNNHFSTVLYMSCEFQQV